MENFVSTTTDFKALRAFRVLRPLRLVSGVPSEWLRSATARSQSALTSRIDFHFLRSHLFISTNDSVEQLIKLFNYMTIII